MQQQLGLEGIPGKLVRVTPARLSAWAGCPRRYRMTYLDKPAPKRGGAWANATLGAVVHTALKAFFELRPEKRTPQRAEVLVHRHWKSDGFADADQAAEHRRRAQRWIHDYVAELPAGFTPVAIERWVSAPVGGIIAEGRVDRVDERNGELVVVDYKTGRYGTRVDDAKNSLALGLYALAVRTTLRRPCNRVELHHLPTGTVAAWDHTAESLDGLRERAESLAGELHEATDALESASPGSSTVAETAFPVRTGPHCSWCDFRAHCTEGQQAAPDLRPWSLLGGG